MVFVIHCLYILSNSHLFWYIFSFDNAISWKLANQLCPLIIHSLSDIRNETDFWSASLVCYTVSFEVAVVALLLVYICFLQAENWDSKLPFYSVEGNGCFWCFMVTSSLTSVTSQFLLHLISKPSESCSDSVIQTTAAFHLHQHSSRLYITHIWLQAMFFLKQQPDHSKASLKTCNGGYQSPHDLVLNFTSLPGKTSSRR